MMNDRSGPHVSKESNSMHLVLILAFDLFLCAFVYSLDLFKQ